MPLYFKSQPTTPPLMEDTLWIEIADAPGEIWDLPEMRDLDDEFPAEEESFDAFLNSDWDF